MQPTPYYNPSRHYNDQSPGGVPSHFSVSRSSASSSLESVPTTFQPLLTEALDECRYSDKELVLRGDKEAIQAATHLPAFESTTISDSGLATANDNEVVQTATDFTGLGSATGPPKSNDVTCATGILLEEPSEWRPIQSLTSINILEEATASPPLRGLKRTRSQLSSIRSIRSMRSIASVSVQSISDQVSRLSRSFSHVESVLSTSNSWRSSLVYAMSIASDRISNSSQDPLTRDEYLSWDALVDESRFVSKSRQRPDIDAKSLRTRPCCEFFENDAQKRTICNVCGFSEMHQLARTSLSDDGGLINSSLIDRFGNSPLHHAAAAGNTARVMQLMSSAGQPPAQNTSGETYLHVLRLGVNDRFPEYIEILKKAKSLDFDFSIRDYNGDTVAWKLREVVLHWDLDSTRQSEIAQIVNVGNTRLRAVIEDTSIPTNAMGSPGLSMPPELPGSPIPSLSSVPLKEPKKPSFPLNVLKLRRDKPAEVKLDEIDKEGDTVLIATLKNWSEAPKSSRQLEKLIRQSDIHMRDRRGYTALAIAVRYGLRNAASLLLKCGANPNTRSYEKTSILEHAAKCMAQAQKEKNERLYSRILSCMVLLSDHGGKARVSVYDEYTVLSPSNKKKQKPSHSMLTANQLQTPLGIIEEDIYDNEAIYNDGMGMQELAGADTFFELADTGMARLECELADTGIARPRCELADTGRSQPKCVPWIVVDAPREGSPPSQNVTQVDDDRPSTFFMNSVTRSGDRHCLSTNPLSTPSNYAKYAQRVSPEEYFENTDVADISGNLSLVHCELSPEDARHGNPEAAKVHPLNNSVSPEDFQASIPQTCANLLSGTKADTSLSLHWPVMSNSEQTLKRVTQSLTPVLATADMIWNYIPQPGATYLPPRISTPFPSGLARIRRRRATARRLYPKPIQSSLGPKSVGSSASLSFKYQNAWGNQAREANILDLEPDERSWSESSQEGIPESQLQNYICNSYDRPKKRRLNSGKSASGDCVGVLETSFLPGVGRVPGRVEHPRTNFGNSLTRSSNRPNYSSACGLGGGHVGVNCGEHNLDGNVFDLDGTSIDYAAQRHQLDLGGSQFSFDLTSLEGDDAGMTDAAPKGGFGTEMVTLLPNLQTCPTGDFRNFNPCASANGFYENVGSLPNVQSISGEFSGHFMSGIAIPEQSPASSDSTSNVEMSNGIFGDHPSDNIDGDRFVEGAWVTSWPVIPSSGWFQPDPPFLPEERVVQETSSSSWPTTQTSSSQSGSYLDRSAGQELRQQTENDFWEAG